MALSNSLNALANYNPYDVIRKQEQNLIKPYSTIVSDFNPAPLSTSSPLYERYRQQAQDAGGGSFRLSGPNTIGVYDTSGKDPQLLDFISQDQLSNPEILKKYQGKMFQKSFMSQGSNPDYYQTQVTNGFNNPLNVSRDASLQDLQGVRQSVADESAGLFRQALQDTFGNAIDPEMINQFTQDVPVNSLGLYQLYGRLERQYGPGWRSVPEAKALADAFQSRISQEQDLGTLSSMISSGKKALDYLNQSPGITGFNFQQGTIGAGGSLDVSLNKNFDNAQAFDQFYYGQLPFLNTRGKA